MVLSPSEDVFPVSVRRFMIPSRCIREGYASFNGDIFNHMVRVLRMEVGEQVLMIDESGVEHCGVIDQITREWVAVKITEVVARDADIAEPPAITLCQALPKGEKLDLVLQKGTELGVRSFHLFRGDRSVARVAADRQGAKMERWERIVREASRQCGRSDVPQVSYFDTSGKAAAAGESATLKLLLWEKEEERSLKSVFRRGEIPASACIAVGPEGGFGSDEAMRFVERGYLPICLGRRILRTETAALAIVSILQYIFDEF